MPALLDDSLSLLRDHLAVLLSSAASIIAGTWLAARAIYLQQVTTAKEHRDYVESQLKDAKERPKELAPQSQAADLAGLLDDLTLKLTATAEAGEALMPYRLVHIAREADGRSVVLLADKLKRLEAHGFVARTYARGEKVRIERLGQFPPSFLPAGRRLFLGSEGQVSENVDVISGSILQRVGTCGPDGICLFKPEEETHIE